MIEVIGSLVLGTAAIAGVEPGAEFANPDVFVKTRVRVEVGVDLVDNWILADADGALSALPLEGIRFATPAAASRATHEVLARTIGLDRWLRIQLEPGADREAILAAIKAIPIVEYAEIDGVGGLASGIDDPDDTFFSLQWGMSNTGQLVAGVAGVPGADVRAREAWELSTGGDVIIVATLDSGAYEHIDLDDRIVPGWNIPQDSSNTNDVCVSHGTHVAGIIAAIGNNATGVAGMCWNARIMPVIVVDPCSGYESWAADGLVWAVDQGADAVNISLQYYTGTEYFHDAIQYAAGLEVPLIAATGNYADTIAYPAKWDETIAVGAIANTDIRWSGSNFGTEIDLVAPGHDVYSTQLVASYGMKSGTSHAAPHVTGMVALLLSHDPSLTNDAIRDILLSTARDISLSGFDEATGWGCLNARAALEVIFPPEPDADLNGDGIVSGFDLTILFAYWGACEGCIADLNGDGLVDGFDLVILLSQWTG